MWVLEARRFVATGDELSLGAAATLCHDPRISRFLHRLAQREGRVDLAEWEPLVRELDGEGRNAEAITVNLLAFRYLADMAQHADQLDPATARTVAAQCGQAAQASADIGFLECEARFALALGTCSLHLGERRQARGVLALSVELYRGLVRDEPARYRPGLAEALNKRAVVAGEQAEFAAARRAYDEALEIRRGLARDDPPRHAIDLVGTLTNLGNLLQKEQRLAEALGVLEEADRTYRALPQKLRAEPQLVLATILTNLGIVHSELRNLAAARDAHEEALAIREAFAARVPERGLPDLSFTYNSLAAVLLQLGELASARELFVRAIEIRMALALQGRAVFFPLVARSLVNLGVVELNDDKPAVAAELFEKAVDAYRSIEKQEAGMHADGLATALLDLGSSRATLRELEAARAALEEAVPLLRGLAASHPAAFQTELALALGNLANVDEAQGDATAALERSLAAIEAAESPGLSRDESWLARGRIDHSYHRVLERALVKGDSEQAFRCLAALRDGKTRTLSADPQDSLVDAAAALAAAEGHIGRPLRVLVAQGLGGSGLLLAVLGPRPEEFRCFRCDRFAAAGRALAERILAVFEPHGAGFDEIVERIREIAAHAWTRLPEPLQELLHPAADHDLLISGDAAWSVFPWEGLLVDPSGDGWLGLHRPLSRWGPLTGPALETLGRRRPAVEHPSAVVLCPWDATEDHDEHLPRARDEAESVAVFLTEAGYVLLPAGEPLIGASADFAAVDEVLSRSATVFHYSGHGTIAAGEEALIVHGGTHSGPRLYGLDAVRKLEQRLDRHPLLANRPLVVLNSCHTGRARVFGGKREDLCSFLISRGAGAVIASAFPVFDEMGALVGKSFYPHTGYPHTGAVGVGEALLRSRRAIERWARDQRRPSWPAWALLVCHGDPYLTLPHLGPEPDATGGSDERK